MSANKNFLKFIFIAAIIAVNIFSAQTFAETELNLQNSPPCLLKNKFGECANPSSLEGYINLVFRFALGIGGFLAVGMIVWGAILISISGSVDKSKEGKSHIQAAFLGLAMLAGTYLILKTINPRLVVLTAPSATEVRSSTSTGGGTGSGTNSEEQLRRYEQSGYCINLGPAGRERYAMHGSVSQDQNRKKSELANSGITIQSSGNCDNMCQVGCTSVAFLPQYAVEFIKNLKRICNCEVVITGGTEIGHQTHGANLPIFDIRTNDQIINLLTESTSAEALNLLNLVSYFNVTPNTNSSKNFCDKVRRRNSNISCTATEPNNQEHIHFKLR